MAALMMVSALPVFGAANRHASCVGAGHSRQTEPGIAGVLHSARKGENGDSQSFFARFVPGGGQGDTTEILWVRRSTPPAKSAAQARIG